MGTHFPTLTVLPFQHVRAFADVESKRIFVSERHLDSIVDDIKHELAHVISADPDHGQNFRDQLDVFGGQQPPLDDTFKKLRRRLGIPSNVAGNIGNITGIQNILTDYHLLQAYRKFSQKILGTEGHWEVLNEGERDATQQKIRLYPTPKGVFPVVVLYYPVVNYFRSPQARKVCMDAILAEAKIVVGTARRKIANMPAPGGGTIQFDGEAMVQEGNQMKEKIIQDAINLGEPMPIVMM